MSQNEQSKLYGEKVFPDVLPTSTTLSADLLVKWPEALLDSPGKELDREATQPEPQVLIKPAPSEKHDDYVLIMTDPDLMSNNDTTFGQVRHWLATNVSVDDQGQLNIDSQSNISSYIGPAPLPNYISPRPHRYVFILARPQTGGSKVTVSNEDLQKLQKNYSAAFEGSQNVQDLKDRWGFNAQKFLDEKNLKVEAVTFMLVGGTLKSAVDNVSMTAQAMAHKVVGS